MDPDAFNLGNGGMTQAEERTYFGLCKPLTPPWMMDTSLWRQLDYGAALASVGFMVWTRHQAGYVESFCRPRAESLIERLGSERDCLRSGCLLKAPLLMGNDVRNMSASTLGIYGAEEVIEVDQTWGKQAGFFRCLNSLAKHSAERER